MTPTIYPGCPRQQLAWKSLRQHKQARVREGLTCMLHVRFLRLMRSSKQMTKCFRLLLGTEYEWAKSGMRSRREEYDETQEQLHGGEREKQLERWNRRQMAQEEARNWSYHIITSSHHLIITLSYRINHCWSMLVSYPWHLLTVLAHERPCNAEDGPHRHFNPFWTLSLTEKQDGED